MIFYFTGTGNSLYAADFIARAQGGDRILSIAKEMERQHGLCRYELGENEMLGFAFPIYAWAPPKIVLDFISRLEVKGNPYVFALCTCGDEEGHAAKVLNKALAKNNLTLNSVFTLVMPNNYIMGYDVDSEKQEKEKLKTAEKLLAEINKVIDQRQNKMLTVPGKYPGLKTNVVNPLFNQFAMNTRHFYADDNCTGCGICEEVCPVHTIKVTDKPSWGKTCTQCLGCIHRCPVRAIQYGKGTVRKGRYHHPILDRPGE
ncbi:MAG: EFR1 family ferrodoxin [Eubacteriales bacterium]|nr:EFR1 family ferrodoxin [Eubacteriales bacterium]